MAAILFKISNIHCFFYCSNTQYIKETCWTIHWTYIQWFYLVFVNVIAKRQDSRKIQWCPNGVAVVENSTSKRLENISERHLSIQNATSIPRLYYLLLCSNQCTHKHHFLAFLILPNKPKKNTSAARRRAVKSTCACVVFVNYGTLNSKSSQTEFSCR